MGYCAGIICGPKQFGVCPANTGNVSSYNQHMEIAAKAGIQDTTNETKSFGVYSATATSCWCFLDEQRQQTAEI